MVVHALVYVCICMCPRIECRCACPCVSVGGVGVRPMCAELRERVTHSRTHRSHNHMPALTSGTPIRIPIRKTRTHKHTFKGYTAPPESFASAAYRIPVFFSDLTNSHTRAHTQHTQIHTHTPRHVRTNTPSRGTRLRSHLTIQRSARLRFGFPT